MTNHDLLKTAHDELSEALKIIFWSETLTAQTIRTAHDHAIKAVAKLLLLEQRLEGVPDPKKG